MPIRIRRAELSDAAAIADLHVRTWQSTYRGLLPDALLDELDVAARTERWQRILGGASATVGTAGAGGHAGIETDTPTSATVVAVEGERVLGFASAGAARDNDAPCARELWALYVDPIAHGAGVGAELLRTAIGADPAYLWVLEGNNRAIAFYEKHGFRLDGGVESEERGGRMLRDLRMARP
ncbi:N-acetyltransferase [Microbacterium faecale]|uniref:N-acetyltransferase n=1 Tax=Microbacterium faecale TaxID=1804630 RepID=A0A917DEN9_9MICO|nr:GNAT family N-acetyltransferase [Microbacterium faecale]GGD31052.1 N-acetyltransferase [Microbacterium faecale]